MKISLFYFNKSHILLILLDQYFTFLTLKHINFISIKITFHIIT